MIKTVKGDLIKLAMQGEFDIIIQGCNCFCAMGGGIARAIADNFPDAEFVDSVTMVGDRTKLGTFTMAMDLKYDVLILNCYTQYDMSKGENVFEYWALAECLEEIKRRWPEASIGMPKIGCGLARGDWGIVENVVSDTLRGSDVTVVIYDEEAFTVGADWAKSEDDEL